MHEGYTTKEVYYRKVDELEQVATKEDLSVEDQLLLIKNDSAKRTNLDVIMDKILEKITIPQYSINATLTSEGFGVNGTAVYCHIIFYAESDTIERLSNGLFISVNVTGVSEALASSTDDWYLKLTTKDGTMFKHPIYTADGTHASINRYPLTNEVINLVFFKDVPHGDETISGWFIPDKTHDHDDRYYTITEIDEKIEEGTKLAESRKFDISTNITDDTRTDITGVSFDGTEDVEFIINSLNAAILDGEASIDITGNATSSSNAKVTHIGNFHEKKISEFKTAVKNWWVNSKNGLYPLIATFGADTSWATNFGTDTATITGASNWQITPIGSSAVNGTYGAFLVSAYGRPIYLLEYKNGNFNMPVKLITSDEVSSLSVNYANYLNAILLPSNSNLNSYTTPGFYYCPISATVGTFTNSPTASAFFMIVGKHAGTSQTVFEYMTTGFHIYHRNCYNGTWGAWIRVYTTIDKPSASDVGASASGHTHNYAGSSSAGGVATSADKLQTPRSINVGTAVTGTATNFDGSSNITIPITEVKEAYLEWGGKNFAGSYGPIDAGIVPELGANRFAFMPPAGIEIQYSQNNGSSWSTYSVSDAVKINLFNGCRTELYIGGSSATNVTKTNFQLRVIITTNTAQVYTALNKFCIYCSTNGSTGSWCTIDAKTKANVDSGNDTWTTLANKVTLAGWPGYNIINTPVITTFGYNTWHYQKLRFTFGVTSHPADIDAGLSIGSIMGFGGMGWQTPSTMAKTGHMYTYDYNKNVTFPGTVSATSFSGNATSASSAAKLSTARTITLSGSVTGSASFDGSGDITITTSTNHSHSYLSLSGGTMTGAISSSLNTGSHIAGNQGTAIINSTSTEGYVMLAKMNSTNGVFTLGKHGSTFKLFYTAKSTVDAGTNTYTKQVTLIDESGNSTFNKVTSTEASITTLTTTTSRSTTTSAGYVHRNIAYGTSETPTTDATYGGSGSIYIQYS